VQLLPTPSLPLKSIIVSQIETSFFVTTPLGSRFMANVDDRSSQGFKFIRRLSCRQNSFASCGPCPLCCESGYPLISRRHLRSCGRDGSPWIVSMRGCHDGKRSSIRHLRFRNCSPRRRLPRSKEGHLVVPRRSIVLTTIPYERPAQRCLLRGSERSIIDGYRFGVVRGGWASMSVWV